jgi:hypothetical protein
MKTMLALIASVMLFAMPGCGPDRALPNPSVPHRLAKPADAVIYVRTSSGDLQEQEVTIPDGWYIAAPALVEGQAGGSK